MILLSLTMKLFLMNKKRKEMENSNKVIAIELR